MEHGKEFDVIHNKMDYPIDDYFYKIVKKLINNDILLDISYLWKWENTKTFMKEGMEEINKICKKNGEYEEVYSRSMMPMSHFLAFAYKVKNPKVKWTAEFSDPLMINSRGETTYIQIDKEDMDKINRIIEENKYPVVNNDNFIFIVNIFLFYSLIKLFSQIKMKWI
ncbi:hypothetical protein [Methanobrevibacter oralis]|uniref:hypothetical protein n=1 Tax=Methanobrevibacter oralis TaxID=66851 RepID=UPI0005B2CB02|nr:hypothetical protein [Methanobrevibacter oralis]